MKQNMGHDCTVLIVDDEVDLLESVSMALDTKFNSILKASNTDEALFLLKRHKVDCLVTDYRMPGKSGLDLIAIVQEQYPDIPTILMTGNGSDKEVLNAIDHGLFDYLDKPFHVPVLINRIRNALLLPKMEQLVLDLAKAEFPDIPIQKFLNLPSAERLKMILATDALIRTRLLAKIGKKAS